MGVISRARSVLFAALILAMASATSASLAVDFYKERCPFAESIVRATVQTAVAVDPGLAAGLIRMQFHDCFVRAEKESPANKPSLRGFEVIYAAKAALEARCPSTVSCADIIAFVARDSALLAGGIHYSVPAGRRDGRVSLESEVLGNIPLPNFTATDLLSSFAKKGLSLDDMVTLSGAHSIGRSHCPSFAGRLYSFSPAQPQDPSMDPALAAYLKSQCSPSTVNVNSTDPTTVHLDGATPRRLDNQYYKNLLKHRGVLFSDQTLQASPLTSGTVSCNAENGPAWAAKFAAAMVKMASIDVLTGSHGEIRKHCWVAN
ncbi:hypothetical protein B296_00040087 [Ensete ventricosum]|uniref:Peroxidase n=1 Tax=Ensete ventricosum TaxID=4639 RepID=A0A426ZIN8_ENSVE|nr:hypothetical protein B296_00040087 [Ensete ventricosum]